MKCLLICKLPLGAFGVETPQAMGIDATATPKYTVGSGFYANVYNLLVSSATTTSVTIILEAAQFIGSGHDIETTISIRL